MIFKFLASLLLLLPFSGIGQTIDSNSSKVDFSISNMKWNTVEGSFSGMQGTVSFSPDDLTTSVFEVCIDSSSVNTKNKRRDVHLKKSDFFGVDRYPKICIESTNVIRTTSGYKLIGTLTMNGITKEVEIPFTLSLIHI